MTKKAIRAITILMVEDDADLCDGWSELFDLLGHRVSCHQKASSALADPAGIINCDLIITDYYLPDLNGVEFIKRAREHKPTLPVIVLTGSRESFIADAIAQLGGCEIVYKPVNIDEIESRIGALFG